MNEIDEKTAREHLIQKDLESTKTTDAPEERTSLGRVETMRMGSYENVSQMPAVGWKNVPVENLPSQGLFYPKGTTIQIKAASVKEIRHFSTIDEDDYIDSDDKLNFILESCSKITIPNNPRSSWKDVQDIDRFYIVYCIRDFTFKNGENKLTMNMSCSNCGQVDNIEITKDNLNFLTIDERIMKYYDPESLCFNITTKSGDQFNLYLPTLGVSVFIKNYVKNKMQNKEYYDKTFLRLAPFLFQDWRFINERSYKEMDNIVYGFGHKKLSMLSGLVDIFVQSISSEIYGVCSGCGSEVSSPLNFQGGFKSLFLYTNIFDELA
jgi:hypothetical protein